MLVGDVETKLIRFKKVVLGLDEKFCPLAWLKRNLAKPWHQAILL